MNIIKKILRVVTILFAVIGFLFTGYIIYDYLIASLGARERGSRVRSVPLHLFKYIEIPETPAPMSIVFPADFSKNNMLLGASNNVFAGKVLAQTGNKETEIGPRTQYQVQVVDNIKGGLTDVVTVDMLGGYDKDGKLVLVESDDLASEDALFKVGSTYLFATRYNAQEDWYTVIAHPNARTVLSLDANITTDDLRTIAENNEWVKTLEVAYPDEVLLEADIAHQNTYNSFQSLPPEAKAAARARADVARAWLETNKAAL